MTTPTPSSTPLMLNQRYRIEEKLGTSRLAVVYRAQDERLKRTVLIHMLRRELANQAALRDRFVQESHANASRSHQSLLELYDSGELANRPFMVTEYVQGPTLKQLGALAVEDALLYFRQVVGAVAVCQAAGIPHPPISSNNLILVQEGHVELLENWQTSPQDLAIDAAAYRAPERTAGQPPTPASAVYALGLLLIEMLAGRRVITGEDPQWIAQQHLTARIPSLAELRPGLYTPGLETLITKATARNPAERLPNAASLAAMLDDVRRAFSNVTQALVPQATSARRRVALAPSPQLAPEDPTPIDQPQLVRRPTQQRMIPGLLVLLLLFVAVSIGAYFGASLLFRNIPQIALPSWQIDLPDWITGVVGGGGEVLIVSGADLNLRSEPDVNAQVLAVLPNQTRVRRLAGPQQNGDIPWFQVRVQVDSETLEGWVSGNFLKTETGSTPQ